MILYAVLFLRANDDVFVTINARAFERAFTVCASVAPTTLNNYSRFNS